MTLFWVLALSFVAVALVMVVPTLWRGRQLVETDSDSQNVAIARERLAELEREHQEGKLDAEDFETAKQELERVLLDDLEAPATGTTTHHPKLSHQAAITLLVLIPLLTGGIYWKLGSPYLIDAETQEAAQDDPHGTPGTNLSMDDMIAKLEQRLEKEPEDYEGWFTLARTYMSLDRYAESVAALEKAHAITGDHPVILMAMADATAMMNDGRMSGRPAELVNKVLAMDPTNITGLWLAGMAAEEEGDYAGAIDYWRKLEPLLADEPESLMEVQALIASVEKKSGISPAETSSEAANNTVASVEVQVTLSAELANLAKPEETLFIYAKAQNGPPMPLAAVRKTVADLPLTVTLDDSMAMMPDRKLSSFEQVKIGALVSRSGVAMAKSGDLVGEVENIAVKDNKVITISIDRQVP